MRVEPEVCEEVDNVGVAVKPVEQRAALRCRCRVVARKMNEMPTTTHLSKGDLVVALVVESAVELPHADFERNARVLISSGRGLMLVLVLILALSKNRNGDGDEVKMGMKI